MAGEKILLVDDDATIRKIARTSLEKDGAFEVAVATNGEECLQLTEEIMPSLILMDMFMPGFDGPSAFQKLQENKALAQIPVVFLTANSSEQDSNHLKKMGAAGVLTKPFQPSQFSSQVRQFLPNGAS